MSRIRHIGVLGFGSGEVRVEGLRGLALVRVSEEAE